MHEMILREVTEEQLFLEVRQSRRTDRITISFSNWIIRTQGSVEPISGLFIYIVEKRTAWWLGFLGGHKGPAATLSGGSLWAPSPGPDFVVCDLAAALAAVIAAAPSKPI